MKPHTLSGGNRRRLEATFWFGAWRAVWIEWVYVNSGNIEGWEHDEELLDGSPKFDTKEAAEAWIATRAGQ